MSPRGGPQARVLVVAGAIGTGKSTVCAWLAQRGAFVIEADRVGHELLLRPDVAQALGERFGQGVRDERGAVDRRRLGAHVFADPQALAELGSIVHPPLLAEIRRRIERLRESRAAELIVVDAALHFQFDPPLPCDAVLMTDAPKTEQVRRIVARDGLSPEEARQRVDRTLAVKASLARADAVIETDRPRAQVRALLLQEVDRLLGLQLAASDPPWAGRQDDDVHPDRRRDPA